MGADRVVIDVDGNKLIGAVHVPDGNAFQASVVLLHGGPGGVKEGPSDLFVTLGDKLANDGLTAVRFDFLGSGESDGEYIDQTPSSHVDQYRHIVDWLHDQGCQRLGVVGESFGGTCALAGYDKRVAALVLLWPAIWLLDGAFAPFVTSRRLEELDEQGWIAIEGQHIGRPFVDELFSDSNREATLRSVASPTLLIHGDQDKEVPVHQSQKAYEILPEPKRLIVVPGAGHCLRHEDEQSLVVKEVLDWITGHVRAQVDST